MAYMLTRFECGVLKLLHDMGGGAKNLHDLIGRQKTIFV